MATGFAALFRPGADLMLDEAAAGHCLPVRPECHNLYTPRPLPRPILDLSATSAAYPVSAPGMGTWSAYFALCGCGRAAMSNSEFCQTHTFAGSHAALKIYEDCEA
jgi:hypothetical protein